MLLARMTDEADSFVVQAELQVAFFRECNNQRLSPCGRPTCIFKGCLKGGPSEPCSLGKTTRLKGSL